MFVNGSEQNEQSLLKTFHRWFLLSFGSLGQAVSDEKIFRNWPIRNKKCLWPPCLLMDQDEMSNVIEDLPYMLPMVKQFQRKTFLEIDQSETWTAYGDHVC